MKQNRPYSCACTRLAKKKMISSLVSNSSSPYNSVFQRGHNGHKAGPSPSSSPPWKRPKLHSRRVSQDCSILDCILPKLERHVLPIVAGSTCNLFVTSSICTFIVTSSICNFASSASSTLSPDPNSFLQHRAVKLVDLGSLSFTIAAFAFFSCQFRKCSSSAFLLFGIELYRRESGYFSALRSEFHRGL
jgi:hypothetical protein